MDTVKLKEDVKNAVKKYSRSLVSVAFNYTKSMEMSEDIVQDVFLTYLKKAPVFNDAEHEKAWLIRVTINRCKNELKSKRYSARSEMPDDLTYLPKEEYDLMGIISTLDEKYRIPIHLYYYEGYSINEIADILSEKPATIGTRLARAKEKLKNKLGENGYEGIIY